MRCLALRKFHKGAEFGNISARLPLNTVETITHGVRMTCRKCIIGYRHCRFQPYGFDTREAIEISSMAHHVLCIIGACAAVGRHALADPPCIMHNRGVADLEDILPIIGPSWRRENVLPIIGPNWRTYYQE